jgi:hypothetical protein
VIYAEIESGIDSLSSYLKKANIFVLLSESNQTFPCSIIRIAICHYKFPVRKVLYTNRIQPFSEKTFTVERWQANADKRCFQIKVLLAANKVSYGICGPVATP